MDTSLKEFRGMVLDRLLSLLWRQWTSLGVAGAGSQETTRVVDPEPLLLFTLTVARHDPRLFDEVLDWLTVNGDFINVQRLKSVAGQFDFQALPQLGAVSEFLGPKSKSVLKWKNVSTRTTSGHDEPLFCLRDGGPVPLKGDLSPEFQAYGLLRNPVALRGYSMPFPMTGMPSLLLRLRALIGISARCELLCILGANAEVHPSEVARQTGYFARTVQNAMQEMVRSGVVEVRAANRQKMYWLKAGFLDGLLCPDGNPTPWVCWSPLFRVLEILWLGLGGLAAAGLDDLTVSSELRRMAMKMRPLLGVAGLGMKLRNESAYPGESYSQVFMEDVAALLDAVG